MYVILMLWFRVIASRSLGARRQKFPGHGSVKTRFHCPHDNFDWVASASSRDVSFEAIYDKRTRPQPLLMEGISEGLDLLRWLHGGFLVGLLLCFGSCALLNIYVLDDKGLCSLCERFM